MKIEIDLPDWVEERRLVILAGIECVASKEPSENYWKIKETRCNQCGMCCFDYPPTPYGVDGEGKCNKLRFDHGKWECLARTEKPYNCLLDPIEDDIGCCITYKKV